MTIPTEWLPAVFMLVVFALWGAGYVGYLMGADR